MTKPLCPCKLACRPDWAVLAHGQGAAAETFADTAVGYYIGAAVGPGAFAAGRRGVTAPHQIWSQAAVAAPAVTCGDPTRSWDSGRTGCAPKPECTFQADATGSCGNA